MISQVGLFKYGFSLSKVLRTKETNYLSTSLTNLPPLKGGAGIEELLIHSGAKEEKNGKHAAVPGP